jgi:hypothetical protein
MELTHIVLALGIIILSIWYSNHITKEIPNEKKLLLRISVTLILLLMAMWVSDIFIFTSKSLLRDSTKDEILLMIKLLLIAIVGLYLNKDKLP